MKNLFLVLGLVTLMSVNLYSARGRDTVSVIKIMGSISNANNCKVELLCANKIIDSIQLPGGRKKFSFKLKANSYYALRISQPGFVTRLVSIDTKCPGEIVDNFAFQFNTGLISLKDAEKLNRDALDFPIAVIHFDGHSEQFVHNKMYTAEIKKDIYTSPSISSEELVRRDDR